MEEYKIVSECIDKINTIGYYVKKAEEEDLEAKLLKVADTIKLARLGKILNAEAILDTDDGKYHLRIGDTINYLSKNKDNFEMVYRIIELDTDNNERCYGYVVKDRNDKQYRIEIKKAWEIAINGAIINIRACVQNNKKILKGINGFSIEMLPSIVNSKINNES